VEKGQPFVEVEAMKMIMPLKVMKVPLAARENYV